MHNRYSKILLAFVLSLALVLSAPLAASAHSGRTDANGGHRDNNNVSGLGYYHYHHGYGPHLHPNGVCPYVGQATTAKSSSNTITTIKAAQQKLKDLGYYTGTVDGSFGPKSQVALKNFQKANNLTVDGKLGPQSKKALGIS